jgi:hypothetical protein
MPIKENNLNSRFYDESTSSFLLDALTSLHDEVRKGLDLVTLQNEMERTVESLYKNGIREKNGEFFPLAISIFLEDSKKRTIVFYALTLNDETKRDALNLQFLSLMGKPYPSGLNKSFIDIALKEKVPLYGERKNNYIEGEFQVHVFDFWIASKLISYSSKSKAFGEPAYQDIILYEPLFSDSSSDPLFFENILISTHKEVWPFSDINMLTSTIISFKGHGKSNRITLSKYLPVLILDCSIGMVISQLFLSYALLNTSLRNLEPLIEEMLTKSLYNIIKSKINKSKSTYNENAFWEDLINLILKIPYPFVQVNVIRFFIEEALNNSKEGLVKFIEPKLEKLVDHKYPIMGSIIVSDSNNGNLLSLYNYIVDGLLKRAKHALSIDDSKKLYPLLGNLGEFLDFRHEDVLTFVCDLLKKNDFEANINQEIFGILAAAISKNNKQWEKEFDLWSLLSDFIRNNSDPDQRYSFASYTASLLSQKGPENIKIVMNLIKSWGLENITENTLIYQLDDTKRRFGRTQNSSLKLFGIFSQKGGVGKSVIALMTATRLAKLLKKKVCLIEIDFGGPTFYNYESLSKGPFVNDFIKMADTDSNISKIYNEKYRGTLQTVKIREGCDISFWPANPKWEEQIQLTTQSSSYINQRSFEKSFLKKMISVLANDYDVIIFDVPAEIKDISLTVGNLISDFGGVIMMVSSLFTPSYSPLIEHYWRFISNKNVTPALIINKSHTLDLSIVNSCRSLADYLLVNTENVFFRAFGMDIHSPALLRTLLPEKMKLIPITYSEEVARVNRNKDINKMIEVLSSSEENKLDQFLSELMENSAK